MPSLVQRLFLTFAPKLAESIEHESRQWIVRCNCGSEKSIWDIGGIRYKASGNPRKYGQCSACGKSSWLRVYRSHPPELASPTENRT